MLQSHRVQKRFSISVTLPGNQAPGRLSTGDQVPGRVTEMKKQNKQISDPSKPKVTKLLTFEVPQRFPEKPSNI